ncbi:hypothetical protein [Actinopolyspora mortivallis]|uniref:hypothetical protein n=1 Tax=Actinopolyspora mortivallis TaxID=33906 RepID=UPI0003756BC9|nr:hypothetical protein [Actinopolyspora mortivallis]
MRVRPTTSENLVAELTETITRRARPPGTRIALDGHPVSGTRELTDSLVRTLRVAGVRAVRVGMWDYLRPASLRFERGRHNPEGLREDWFDLAGLSREVLTPLAPGGSGHVLPALWDPDRDRSPRLARTDLGERGMALVEGPLLLGHGLDFDFTVHLWVSEKVLHRRTPVEDRWQLPAFAEYARRTRPERTADRVIRMDHPERPAVVDALD